MIIKRATNFDYLLLFTLGCQLIFVIDGREAMFEVIYTNIEPYINVINETSASGIGPEIFEFADLFCHDQFKGANDYDYVFHYNTAVRSMTHLNDLLNSDEKYGHGELENATGDYAFWFPIYETIDYHAYKNIKKRSLSLIHISYVDEMVIIAPEKRIHLIEKVWVGLSHCTSVAILACVGGVSFAITIWLLEHFKNADFSKHFAKGFGTGAWLTVVTMGTVGYGDITPKSLPGRLVAFFWMIISVVFSSVMTATISDTVHGVSSLELYDQTITGIAHTPEETIAKNDYNAKFYGVETFDEMVLLLQNHTVKYGILNSDVAAYYQDKFYKANKGDDKLEQLVYVYTIKVKIPIEFLVNMNTPDVAAYINCLQDHKEEIFPSVLAKYKKHLKLETLHHISICKLFLQYPVLGYVSAILTGVLMIGFLYDFFTWYMSPTGLQKGV